MEQSLKKIFIIFNLIKNSYLILFVQSNTNPKIAPIVVKIKKLSVLESFFIVTKSGKMDGKNAQAIRF
jgi:hypothetical protein